MGIPLRGAITLGDAVLDSTQCVYLGKPLVEAANLEKGQEWIGLTLGVTAAWSPFLAQQHGATLFEYPAPMKTQLAKYASPIVVDWPRRWRESRSQSLADKLAELADSNFITKWNNTRSFVEFSQAHHDWSLHPDQLPPGAFLRLVNRAEADVAD